MEDNISYIDKHRKKYKFNVGIMVFGLVFIYILANLIIYLAKDPVSIYEVKEGSLYRNTSYTGFIKRNEMVVSAEKDGYVNYLVPEGTKVGMKTRVYTSTDNKLEFDDSTNEVTNSEFTDNEIASLYEKVGSMSARFNNTKFEEVYLIKDTLVNAIDNKSTKSRSAQIDDMLQAGMQNLGVYNSQHFGLINYAIDGYEGVSEDKISADDIEKKNYKRTNMGSNEMVKTGEPVYKVITDDFWTVVVLLDKKTASELKERTSVSVKFVKDGSQTVAGIYVKERDGKYFGYLSFNKGIVRYFKDRFIDIELILENVSGLKIPKSSVIEKEFYEVPEDYITYGGNSKSSGILLDKGTDNPEFMHVNIYATDTKDGVVFLDKSIFKDTSKSLILTDSNQSLKLSKTKKLEGVYNVNKGYALFKTIDILSKNDDYYIVLAGGNYGISNYDHIALDGSKVKESDVVFY